MGLFKRAEKTVEEQASELFKTSSRQKWLGKDDAALASAQQAMGLLGTISNEQALVNAILRLEDQIVVCFAGEKTLKRLFEAIASPEALNHIVAHATCPGIQEAARNRLDLLRRTKAQEEWRAEEERQQSSEYNRAIAYDPARKPADRIAAAFRISDNDLAVRIAVETGTVGGATDRFWEILLTDVPSGQLFDLLVSTAFIAQWRQRLFRFLEAGRFFTNVKTAIEKGIPLSDAGFGSVVIAIAEFIDYSAKTSEGEFAAERLLELSYTLSTATRPSIVALNGKMTAIGHEGYSEDDGFHIPPSPTRYLQVTTIDAETVKVTGLDRRTQRP
jgi:hypothetical protein